VSGGGLKAVPRHPGPRVNVAQARARIGGCELAVPASSANMGPGFDTLAVALQLYLRVRVCQVRDDAVNGLDFDLCGSVLTGDNHVERALRAIAADEDLEFPSLALEVRSDIPMQGGLGSSAAATVAGLLLYERLAGPRPGRDLLTLATRLDGHADNVAAALLGGLTTSCVCDDGRVIAHAVPWPESIRFVIASPAASLATPESRRVLPDAVPRADAVFNLQRALLLVRAVEHGEHGYLREALRDRWHQPFRAPLVPAFAEALALEHPHLLGVCLSGSGPSILALCAGATDEIAAALSAIYGRLGVSCTVQTVAAHQPGVAT
jgi:homoserine kinase